MMGLQDDLLKFETDLDRLIREYEKYFLGLEKREPLSLRSQVERTLRTLLANPISNTMLKFRLGTLATRLATYREHWNKTVREIEEGRYSRDRFRMQLKNTPSPEASASPPPPPDPFVTLHRQLIEAHRSCNLTSPPPPLDTFRDLLRRKREEILKSHPCRDVEFTVVVDGGKPKIRAIPVR